MVTAGTFLPSTFILPRSILPCSKNFSAFLSTLMFLLVVSRTSQTCLFTLFQLHVIMMAVTD